MIKEIKKARKSIYIEMYIFIGDTLESHDFISALKERSSSGVEVTIVADSFGSSKLKDSIIRDLRSSGVEILFFSHWLRRTHRKMLIIDNRITFLGGVNIKKNMIDWLDLQIKIISPRLAKNVLRSFAYTYKMSGGKKENILKNNKRSIFKTIRAQFLEHFPNNNIYSLQVYYQEKLISAQNRIVIITPYFTPPRWLVALLDSAIKRGVVVDIFIPQKTDIKFINRINRAYVNSLSDLKINFYFQNRMNHAKILLIDDQETLIGSQNLDLFSFRLNLESGVFIKDKFLINDLNKVIEKWRRDSVKLEPQRKKISLLNRIIFTVIRIFFSIL